MEPRRFRWPWVTLKGGARGANFPVDLHRGVFRILHWRPRPNRRRSRAGWGFLGKGAATPSPPAKRSGQRRDFLQRGSGQWRRSHVKSGDKYWEEWRGGVWGGAVPSPVGGLGACPHKKNQFCAKNYAILSKFWYFFPILQHKNGIRRRESGGYPPVLKVGDLSPCPPCSDSYGSGLIADRQKFFHYFHHSGRPLLTL